MFNTVNKASRIRSKAMGTFRKAYDELTRSEELLAGEITSIDAQLQELQNARTDANDELEVTRRFKQRMGEFLA